MTNHDSAAKISRRQLLRAAAGTAAYAALPAWSATRSRASGSVPASSASVGYWIGGRNADPAHLRAGWRDACASSARHGCVEPLLDELVDAASVRGEAGSFRVRAVALANGDALAAVRLLALYGTAAHELWAAWRGGASSPVATRMVSNDGAPLSLALLDAAGARDVALPARAGTYVLALGTQRVSWRRWSLVAPVAARPLAREVVARADGTRIAAPYLLVAVERLG